MTEAVLVAMITGGLTLLGVIIANGKTQAVTEAKLEELTREVREHNNFARRVPILEEQNIEPSTHLDKRDLHQQIYSHNNCIRSAAS